MLFAEDVFWKWPSLYDSLSVVGLLASIVSIWLALLLAKKDLAKRLKEAEDRVFAATQESFRRLSLSHVLHEVQEIRILLTQAESWLRIMDWPRGGSLLVFAIRRCTWILDDPALPDSRRVDFVACIDSLNGLESVVSGKRTIGKAALKNDEFATLTVKINWLIKVERQLLNDQVGVTQ